MKDRNDKTQTGWNIDTTRQSVVKRTFRWNIDRMAHRVWWNTDTMKHRVGFNIDTTGKSVVEHRQ